MAINTDLLVSAAILQDYLVDKDTGLPLAAGIVSLYQDNNRTTFKNWYYQSGVAGAYTYLPLDNPMTLSAVGTIVDPSGNDTIPFFYPFSETDNLTPQTYYVTVVDSTLEAQFVRQNFPSHTGGGGGGGIVVPVNTTENLIVNNVFYRPFGAYASDTAAYTINAGTLTNSLLINGSTVFFQTIAPSQHDTFSMPDIQYQKNLNGATETITITPFILGTNELTNDITPEYYINHNCTDGQAGETFKCYQFPISLHIKTLESQQASFTIQAKAGDTNPNDKITFAIYQFLGTGVTSNMPIIEQTITLIENWTKYIIPFTFPSAGLLTLGDGGDDALYLQVQMPVGVTFNISFTKPSIYLLPSTNVPTNDFTTYDVIDTVISSARTGDVRISANSFSPFGWVPMNDGVLSNGPSTAVPITLPTGVNSARQAIDTWALFNLIWNMGKPYSLSSTNPLIQMWDNTGAMTAYGSTAISDFAAGNQLALTSMLGRAIIGIAPLVNVMPFTNDGSPTLTYSLPLTFAAITGEMISFTVSTGGTLPSPLVAGTIYYYIGTGASTFTVASTYANALTAVNIGNITGGSGTFSVTVAPVGSRTGEAFHTNTIAEMPAHNHPGSSATAPGSNSNTGDGFVEGQQQSTEIYPVNLTIASQGGGVQANNTPLSVFYNMFIKL